MKGLIWFVSLLAVAVITTVLKKAGISLGFIPTFLLYGAGFFVAGVLCKKWEFHSVEKAASKAGMTPFAYVKAQIPATIVNHLETEKQHPAELEAYLKNCVKEGFVKRVYADILISGYVK